jgi:hypothetical protein
MRTSDELAVQRDTPSYTESRRASTRCVRELERLMEDVVMGTKALGIAPEPVIRLSPNRCIVQVGPVALTIAWLQNPMGFVSDGELLIILWDGQVAPAKPARIDTTAFGATARSATALWEGVYTVAADDPESWAWVEKAKPQSGLNSPELALHCIAQLHEAYLKQVPPAA